MEQRIEVDRHDLPPSLGRYLGKGGGGGGAGIVDKDRDRTLRVPSQSESTFDFLPLRHIGRGNEHSLVRPAPFDPASGVAPDELRRGALLRLRASAPRLRAGRTDLVGDTLQPFTEAADGGEPSPISEERR